MTIQEILEQHPQGIDYAHLLNGMENVPVILDSNNDVLSFPPIINRAHNCNYTNQKSIRRCYRIKIKGM